ncbi:40S ribosomal protein S19-1 [Diplonema papillatum]|nr:40S ribosomal protein S19-1 [Diplonema papillatum]
MVKATKDVKGKAVTLKDADAAKFVAAYAKHLKAQGKLEIPKWTELAKTGTMCELAPQDPDWFFNRVASVARQVYIRSGSGIGGLRKRYGGSYQKNCIRPHFQRAAGGPIRKALQSLEALGILEKKVDGGRQITAKGAQDMDRIAAGVVLGQ